jgi:hypothetical protein
MASRQSLPLCVHVGDTGKYSLALSRHAIYCKVTRQMISGADVVPWLGAFHVVEITTMAPVFSAVK